MSENTIPNASGMNTTVVPDVTGGLNVSVPPQNIEDGQLAKALNIVFRKGLLQQDTGYERLGGAIEGIPQGVYQFFITNGADYLILITTASVYVRDAIAGLWLLVSSGVSTTAAAGSSGVNLKVASNAAFSAGDIFYTTITNGTVTERFQTKVASVSGGDTIVMEDSIPGGWSVSVGIAVVKAVQLSGSLDNIISAVVVSALDWFVFTNGVDTPQVFNGTSCVDLPSTPVETCSAISTFNGYLLLLNTTESGVLHPQRIRWNLVPDVNSWDPLVDPTSGYQDLNETEDFILQAEPLGPYLIIYKERSIYRVEYVGATDKTFDIINTVGGEGILSTECIVNMGDYHFFVGHSNIYEYRGGFDMNPVGDDVYYILFGTQGNLNPEFSHRLYVTYVEELDEMWINFPFGTSEVVNRTLRLSMEHNAWSLRDFAHDFAGFGFYKLTSSRTWATAVGSWADQTNAWVSISSLANSPTLLLCGYDGYVYEYNYSATTDAGEDIEWEFETKAFTDPYYLLRSDRLSFFASGQTVNVLVRYSPDGEWVTLKTLTLDVELARYVIWFQKTSRYFQFRLSGVGGNFKLSWFAFTFKVEPEW